MSNINTIFVVDCLNAVENYGKFGHYVYAIDSKNDCGIGEVAGDIKQMTINCNSLDNIYFWSRGIVPSDMPAIQGLDCKICNIVPNPIGKPAGTWMAQVIGNGTFAMNCKMAMPDGTSQSFVININSQNT